MARSPCNCEEPDRRLWRITTYKGNLSHFSKGGYATSAYSQLRCLECGRYWRTKAKYVDEIAMAEDDEAYRLTPQGGVGPDGKPGPKGRPLTRAQQTEERQRRWEEERYGGG